jgi:hypothetical protein
MAKIKAFNFSFMALFMGTVAILAGAAVVLLGDYLLGVNLELFHGIGTFSPIWVLDLFVVPFIAGIVVSMIYGLGGKILAYFSPLIIRIASYIQLNGAESLPEGVSVLPLGYWTLVIIVAIEFSALGGIVGEIIIKRTYGRTSDKSKLHKKFQTTEQSAE